MPREKLEIFVERVPHNGHLILTTIHKGEYLKQVYIDYPKREALQLFRQYVREKTEKPRCEAFLLCKNPATTSFEHPIIGTVPSCERCKKRST